MPPAPPSPPEPGQFRTPAGTSRHEIEKIKGSRFLAELAPVRTEEEALSTVARLRREFHDARHHCWAYRLAPTGAKFRSSDDGEPSGSAGRPILQQLEAAGLCDAVVVVVRWFGGTKLGVGGLVRAYGEAAAEVLTRAPVRCVVLRRAARLRYPYEATAFVQRLAEQLDVHLEETSYAEEVEQVAQVPLVAWETFLGGLSSGGAGRIHVSPD